ncbi:MAG: DegT/DnrJ/EryC1/StrS family aminotransferase [Bacteroidota bacterium]
MSVPVPFLSFQRQNSVLRTEILNAIASVHDSNNLILGDQVAAFEQEYAAFLGVPYCIGVANGLEAMVLSLKALGIGNRIGPRKEEVIVPANTYIATWLAVTQAGAIPVPVEPDMYNYNLHPARLEEKITQYTRAILPVHLFGQPADMDPINYLAGRYGLFVVEDNAHSHGAVYKGKVCGTMSAAGAHSFYPTKVLGALGDAGAITTTNETMAETLRAMRNYGSTRKNYHENLGFNSRLDEVQAAVLRVKLRHLPVAQAERRNIAETYLSELAGVGDLSLPRPQGENRHAWHLFVIRTASRDALAEFLRAEGIETMVHYPVPPHRQNAYKNLNFKDDSFPLTNLMARTMLTLPLFPGMRPDEIKSVTDAVKKFFTRSFIG